MNKVLHKIIYNKNEQIRPAVLVAGAVVASVFFMKSEAFGQRKVGDDIGKQVRMQNIKPTDTIFNYNNLSWRISVVNKITKIGDALEGTTKIDGVGIPDKLTVVLKPMLGNSLVVTAKDGQTYEGTYAGCKPASNAFYITDANGDTLKFEMGDVKGIAKKE